MIIFKNAVFGITRPGYNSGFLDIRCTKIGRLLEKHFIFVYKLFPWYYFQYFGFGSPPKKFAIYPILTRVRSHRN